MPVSSLLQQPQPLSSLLVPLCPLQYVREHGEACPATWKPGQKGISEDLKKIFTDGLK